MTENILYISQVRFAFLVHNNGEETANVLTKVDGDVVVGKEAQNWWLLLS